MDSYLRKYWSLYMDFIDIFKEVVYKDIPIVFLLYYQHLLSVDTSIKESISHSGFDSFLINKILTEREIQPFFDHIFSKIAHNDTNKKKGKVVINEFQLKIPEETYTSNFNLENTIILRHRKNENDYLGMEVHGLDQYRMNIHHWLNEAENKIKSLFALHNSHPVFGNKEFQKEFFIKIPVVANELAAIDNFFLKNDIAGVLMGTTTDALPAFRALSLVALKNGIPSICLQHGIIGREEDFLPVFVTRHAVHGHYEKDFLIRKGVSKETIEITGHPRFDDIYSGNRITKHEFFKSVDLDVNKKTILISTQPFAIDDHFNELMELLVQTNSFNVLIRPHPNEVKYKQIEKYEALCKQHPSIKIVGWGCKINHSLYDTISNVDIVIVKNSTVALEAMLLNKPVFFLQSKKEPERHYEFFQNLYRYIFTDAMGLYNFIIQFFSDSFLQKEVCQDLEGFLTYAYPQKRSSEIFSNFVYEVCNNKELQEIQDGLLVKGSDHSIFVIDRGLKRHIASPSVFLELGFQWANVVTIDDPKLKKIPTGNVINYVNDYKK